MKRHKVSDTIEKNLIRIKKHRKAAKHLQAASKFHLEAASHYEEGNHQKAEKSTIAAHGQVTLSNKAQKTGIKQQGIVC
ncbi:hypothetical protein [Lutibacter citreus]|uniref:hypothetical protein n=1 Tax=Lutibacter citreus TaxID=2138210 RepID=UPI000DBE1698|nr:hypothetical protein [Lutibacter citreus]